MASIVTLAEASKLREIRERKRETSLSTLTGSEFPDEFLIPERSARLTSVSSGLSPILSQPVADLGIGLHVFVRVIRNGKLKIDQN